MLLRVKVAALLASVRAPQPRAPRGARALMQQGQDPNELFRVYAPPQSLAAPLVGEPTMLGDLKKPRALVHRDGDFHRSVHVWLVDPHRQLLLQQRSASKDTHPCLLDVSCAGHITGDDAVLDTAVRELYEELGVRVDAESVASARLCTLPSVQEGHTARHGPFICREFQDLFLLRWPVPLVASDFTALDAGEQDEVAGVVVEGASSVLAALRAGDAAYVPRGELYCAALESALDSIAL